MPSVQRDFIRVDLSNYEERREEIIKTLMKAATEQGFFYGKKMALSYCASLTQPSYSGQSWYIHPGHSHHVPNKP